MKIVDIDKLLPEDIPAGEPVLWQGRPQWTSLARRAFRLNAVVAYFGLLAAWAFVDSSVEAGIAAGAMSFVRMALIGVLACALLLGLAFLSARTTLYVVTSRRIVMRIGMALPIFYNLPFATITSAEMLDHGDGTGDLPVSLAPGKKVGYLHLWPHARPFHLANPQPALRCIPRVAEVASLLAHALCASHERGTVPDIIRNEAFAPGDATTAAA